MDMSALFASGSVIEWILVLVVLEALGLFALHRLTGRGPAIADLLPNLAAGACLLLAVHAALLDRSWVWVAAPLGAALVAHLLDLSRRWPAVASNRPQSVRNPAWIRADREKDYDSV